MNTTSIILSIRGGGIRGIIPACALIELESQLGGLTRDHISYCAGTSTGALLTACVAAGIPATEILKIYTERATAIFTPRGFAAEAKRVATGHMYDSKNLHEVLLETLGPIASAWTMNDCPIGVMIAATAMDGHNWYFVRDTKLNNRTTGAIKLVDAATASACAPTYFNDWAIANLDGQTRYFFDGGCGGTANPVYEACVEAFEYDTLLPSTSKAISLGTGYFPQPSKPPAGIVGAIGWVTSTLIDSAEDWADDATARQWPGVMRNFNPLLPGNIGEDDLGAIPQLVQVGQKFAAGLDWKQLLTPNH